MRILGIILVICGVALVIYGGLTLVVPRKVVDLGAVNINVTEDVIVPLPPVIGYCVDNERASGHSTAAALLTPP